MRRALAAAVITVALIVGAGACQKVTKSVATSISPCFRVLPQAQLAVGKREPSSTSPGYGARR